MSRHRHLIGITAVSLWLYLPGSAISADEITQRPMISGNGEEYVVRQLDSDQQDPLCKTYQGKVMLVVNTASRCAYTDQYDDLERLYASYRDRGLVVLGFPSNDFGNQEPGSEDKIKQFCRLTYGVQFPMYAKTHIKGDQPDPLYRALIRAAGEAPKWNFHKYLIDREGRLVGSYGSHVSPDKPSLTEAIEGVL
jgi:glutathione peroxidase